MLTRSHFAEINLELSRLLAESETAAEALTALLPLLATTLSWDYAALWRIDYDQLSLRCAAAWHASGKDFGDFHALTLGRPLQRGVGVPGTVWKTRQSQWLDLEQHDQLPRMWPSGSYGLKTCLAVPVAMYRDVLGVIELFSLERRPPDKDVTSFMELVGQQLGLFIDRIQAQEGLTSSEAQFRLLANKSLDCIVTIDENSRIIFANAQMSEVFGHSHSELVGADLTIIIPERLRAMHKAGLSRYLTTGKKNLNWDSITLPALHKDGHEFQVEVRFGEFSRIGRRLFSGYIKKLEK